MLRFISLWLLVLLSIGCTSKVPSFFETLPVAGELTGADKRAVLQKVSAARPSLDYPLRTLYEVRIESAEGVQRLKYLFRFFSSSRIQLDALSLVGVQRLYSVRVDGDNAVFEDLVGGETRKFQSEEISARLFGVDRPFQEIAHFLIGAFPAFDTEQHVFNDENTSRIVVWEPETNEWFGLDRSDFSLRLYETRSNRGNPILQYSRNNEGDEFTLSIPSEELSFTLRLLKRG